MITLKEEGNHTLYLDNGSLKLKCKELNKNQNTPIVNLLNLNYAQTKQLVNLFGGEDAKISLDIRYDGHSGYGVYAHFSEYPEEGSAFIDPNASVELEPWNKNTFNDDMKQIVNQHIESQAIHDKNMYEVYDKKLNHLREYMINKVDEYSKEVIIKDCISKSEILEFIEELKKPINEHLGSVGNKDLRNGYLTALNDIKMFVEPLKVELPKTETDTPIAQALVLHGDKTLPVECFDETYKS